ncbi:MAG: hypothetical protein V3T86_08675, partial [Planctomycetota bacterium]
MRDAGLCSVAVLWGGFGREREISCISGRQVLKGLDRERFRPVSVEIREDRRWSIEGEEPKPAWEAVGELGTRCDVAFVALHGPFGEDGTLQGFLETAGMPYVGSRVAGSALACDKIRTKRLLEQAGMATARDLVLTPDDPRIDEVGGTLGYPVFAKHPREGSSLGMRCVDDAASLRAAVAEFASAEEEGRVLVEEALTGAEVTAAVLENESGEPEALPLVLIEPRGGFFDFESKYTKGGAEKICPAPLQADVAARIRATALDAHERLGLRHMSRSAFMVSPTGACRCLEINTIP